MVTMCDEEAGRSRSHGLRSEVLDAQAERLGVRRIWRACAWADYDAAFADALAEAARDGVTHVIFGDILFDEHRRWAEQACAPHRLTAVEPLFGSSTTALFEAWTAAANDAVIVTARAECLDDSWLGRPLRRAMLAELLERCIAVVPQDTHSAFDFTALEIVLMGRYPHRSAFELEGATDLSIARDALAATGTIGLEARPFVTLSGGEKQRVVIASALAQASDVLLLDEPTASLDPGFQLEIAALLLRLNRERGVTMAVSTHDLNLAATLCSDLVLLK